MSPVSKRNPPPAWALAFSSIAAELSIPTVSAAWSRAWSARVSSPVPQPRSTARPPGEQIVKRLGPLLLEALVLDRVPGVGHLLRVHERVAHGGGRHEVLLDRPRRGPADQVQLRAGLVVGPRRPAPAERLLPHHRAGRLVVDVEIARRVAQVGGYLVDRL